MTMKAVSLLSGGLDSVVATWLAAQEHDIRLCLTCDYGQRAAAREIEAAGHVAAALGMPHKVVPLPWVGQVAGDALTTASRALPELSAEELDTKAAVQSAAAVWVPNRNGLLLNVAGVFAEALGCQGIVVGFNAEEGATFPDNTPAFMHAAGRAFSFSTRHGLQVLSPTVAMTKRQIVQAGYEAQAPLQFVWSCYEGGQTPCRKCESCLRSARAFAEG
jgi:7-cyano-7-deazaguanine synthase